MSTSGPPISIKRYSSSGQKYYQRNTVRTNLELGRAHGLGIFFDRGKYDVLGQELWEYVGVR